MLEIFLSALFRIMECTLFLLSQCSFCQATLPWVGQAVSQHKNRQLKNLELYALSGIDIAKPFRVTFFEGDHLSSSRPALQKHPALTHTKQSGQIFKSIELLGVDLFCKSCSSSRF